MPRACVARRGTRRPNDLDPDPSTASFSSTHSKRRQTSPMSRNDPRRHSRCSAGSRPTTSPILRAISKSSGLRPWMNSAPSSTGTGHVLDLRVQTRPPVRRRASRTTHARSRFAELGGRGQAGGSSTDDQEVARFHGSPRSKADASFSRTPARRSERGRRTRLSECLLHSEATGKSPNPAVEGFGRDQ